MCGIGGFFISPNSTLLTKEEDISKLRTLTIEMLKELQTHGKIAAGAAIVSDGGIRVFKQPVVAGDLVKMPLFIDFLSEYLDNTTISVMVHTRLPTCGDKENNDNNHPVIHGDVVGVHNGHIGNHEDLFDKLKVKRIGEVDSEAIFALLNLAWAHEIKGAYPVRDVDYTDAVVKSLPSVTGSYAFAAVNARIPGRLALAREGSPCIIVKSLWKKPEKIVTFSTTLKASEDAGKTAGLWDKVAVKDYDSVSDKHMLHIRTDHKGEIDLGERKIGG